ncbi:hypothetical protein GAYE_SCF59G6457 [Galdieria yellowstonensis]|uniref:Uncharacterized protein n=1 Tax=Galdieria yellowstonensis TaxID=3028027 RepID=A0AAV9IM04_9RHOD|nr:hypothetical protein GAYE_SCF59G6457 [Galdieria yellowstonensis]
MYDLHSLVHQGRQRLDQLLETGKAHTNMTVEQLKSLDDDITQHTKGFFQQSYTALRRSYPFLLTGMAAAVFFYPSMKIWGTRTALRNSFVVASITAVSLYPDFKQVLQDMSSHSNK